MEKSDHQIKHIGAVLYPGCVALDLVGPIEAFNYVALMAAEEAGAPELGYRITLIGEEIGPVPSMSGLRLCADTSYKKFNEALNILLVPGMKSGDCSYQQGGLPEWIKAQAVRSERIASVCSGAYVLAHAGILAGHKVTTHWNHGNILQQSYPDIHVDATQIHCKSGNIYSSAGVTAGIDLALAIIEEDFGRALALKVAKRLVVFLKRPGDQAQFSDLLSAQSVATRFTALLEWAEGHLASDLTIEALADQCAMSPRNFSRMFHSDIGLPPMHYIRQRRLERARLLLEDTEQSLAMIARSTGFMTVERLARTFRSAWHVSPAQYRKRFQ